MISTVPHVIQWLRRSHFSFGKTKDPRRSHGRKHSLRGLLNLIVTSMACVKLPLRAMENFGAALPPKVLKRLGLNTAPSDTTLYNLLAKLRSRSWSQYLYQQSQRAIRCGLLRNDLLAAGMLSIDGKGAGGELGEPPNAQCRHNICDTQGTPCWDVYTLRAVLTSSSARPCMDQVVLPDGVGEPTAFPLLLERVLQHFPLLFRIVASDAGITSRANARLVRKRHKHYLFALKGQFEKLYAQAFELLSTAPIVAETVERYQGHTVQHLLRRVTNLEGFDFPDAAQLWMVDRIVTDKDGAVSGDFRIFITSIPITEFSEHRILDVVRMHWGIENNANWTADMVLKEDTYRPCNKDEASITLTWLRMLAFNMLALFRAAMPLKDKHPISWQFASELLADLFKQLIPSVSVPEVIA